MRIQVKVIPRAKRPGVEQLADGTWRVAVRIVRGIASRLKEVEVSCPHC